MSAPDFDDGHLPPPPYGPEVDLRGTPLPIDLFIQMAMEQFGVTREEAERMVREVAAQLGESVGDIGHD